MTAPAGVPICECAHPQTQHKGLKDGCRRCDLGCARYVEDAEATAKAQAEFADVGVDDARRLAEAHAEKEREAAESAAARLRRVTQERDEARTGLANALQCFDDLQSAAGKKYLAYDAELASARTELDVLGSALERERQTARDFEAVAAREVETLRDRAKDLERIAAEELAKLRGRTDALVAETERLRAENQRLNSERDELVAEALDATVDEPQTTAGEAVINIRITVNGQRTEGAGADG